MQRSESAETAEATRAKQQTTIVLTGKETDMTTVRWCATAYPSRPVSDITFNPCSVFVWAPKERPELRHPVGDLDAECQWHASALPDLAKV